MFQDSVVDTTAVDTLMVVGTSQQAVSVVMIGVSIFLLVFGVRHLLLLRTSRGGSGGGGSDSGADSGPGTEEPN